MIDVEGILIETSKEFNLTEADMNTIILGDQLTDKHINFAQAILKDQCNLGELHCFIAKTHHVKG